MSTTTFLNQTLSAQPLHREASSLAGRASYGVRNPHVATTKLNRLPWSHPVTAVGPRNLPVNTVHFLCGTAVFRESRDVVLALPVGTSIYYADLTAGILQAQERGNAYAGMLAFELGRGRVAVAGDRGIFRHLVKTFNGVQLPVTMNNPDNQNAALFVNTMRWLADLN